MSKHLENADSTMTKPTEFILHLTKCLPWRPLEDMLICPTSKCTAALAQLGIRSQVLHLRPSVLLVPTGQMFSTTGVNYLGAMLAPPVSTRSPLPLLMVPVSTTAMRSVVLLQIVTTSTTLTSGAHTTLLVKNPTCFTRVVAVSVLIMGWNCRPIFTEITLRTNQANMKMPVTSRSTVPAVLHGIRCRVHHG